MPNPGQPIPPPGTVVSFTVTATSKTDSSITQTQTETFTVPNIDAVTVTAGPTAVSTVPGGPVTDTLTITNVGNVPEKNIALTDTLPSGLTLTGLAPISVAVGQSMTETITLTPDPSTPLNTTLDATITATFGSTASPVTQTVQVPVTVVAPGVAAISGASVAAGAAGNASLSARLNDLSIALTTLYQNPTDSVANSQATAALDSLISQVTNDPFLASFAPGMTTAREAIANATSAADVSTALTNLGNAMAALAQGISDEAAHSFTLGLLTTYQQAEPQTPAVFQILLTNTGSQTTTYDLSVSGLPANVTSAFSQTSVTLAPGAAIIGGTNGVTLSLTETGDTLFATGFTVTATAQGAPEITNTTSGALTLRDTFLQVSGVTANTVVSVLGTSGPWEFVNGGLNTNYQYGDGDQGAPTIVSAADGIALVAGESIRLQYLSGLVTPGVNDLASWPYVDANGETSVPAPDNSSFGGFGIAPSYYMPSSTYPIYWEELVGTFANSSGTVVGTPFAIGDSATVVVPAGATQLELGVNDAGYSNDAGTLSIEVSVVPQPSSPPFVAPGARWKSRRRCRAHSTSRSRIPRRTSW